MMDYSSLLSSNKAVSNKVDISQIKEIEVVFKTNLPEEFRVQQRGYTIPIGSNKQALNKLLKKLLDKEGKQHAQKNFEFYINNQIVDSQLNAFLLANQDSLNFEKVSELSIEIFYFFELSEPELINTVKEDEWVRKISVLETGAGVVSGPQHYCVGLFNGEVSFYDHGFKKAFTVNNVTTDVSENLLEMLNDLIYIKPSSKGILLLATRSEQENASIYEINPKQGASKKVNYIGKLTNEYINTLSVNPADLNFFCSGDTSGSVRIFKLNDENENAVSDNRKTNKKQRVEVARLNHVNELQKTHNDVKLVKWINNLQLVTSGDDFSIKVWNTSTGANYCSFNGNYHIATSFASFNNTEGILAGYDDGKIKTWDIRAPSQISGFTVNAHRNRVSEIKTNPLMQNMFVSIGYDGMVKVWDLRSKKPLHEIVCDDGEKNFALAFNSEKYFLVGGDNSATRIFETGL